MFTFDAAIDAVQNSKKKVIDTVVTDKTVASVLTHMVEAETAYAKTVCQIGTDAASYVNKELARNFLNSAKTDYSGFAKANEIVMDACSSMLKAFSTSGSGKKS